MSSAPVIPAPPTKRSYVKKSHQFTPTEAKAAIGKRWDAVAAEEGEIRTRYKSELTVDEGMAELAKIRRVCEIAASEINQRMNAAGEKFDICQMEFDGIRVRPVQISAKKDPATGVLYNKFYCSIL